MGLLLATEVLEAEEPVPAGVSIGLGLLLIAAGFLVWIVAVRGADGRLEKNWLAGIRTRATMRSDKAWLAAHQKALGPTKLAAIASAATGLLLIALRPEGIGFAFLMIGGAILLPALVIYGAVLGNRAAKEAEQAAP